jgi:hypothetical protein
MFTSFPEDYNQEPPPELPEDPSPIKLWTLTDVARFLGTRSQRSTPSPDYLSYRELKPWCMLDEDGLTVLVTRLVREGFPAEMKKGKVLYIHKPGKTNWGSPKSYRAISLLSTLGKMAEKAVAGYPSLNGEEKGWWHPGQCGSRAGRSTIGIIYSNRRLCRQSALIMPDVVTALPSTPDQRVLKMLVKHGAHPTFTRWPGNWLSDRSIETWVDGRPVSTTPVNCGVPQGSPCSPVLFALTLAEAVQGIRPGISSVNDCSWIIFFNSERELKHQAIELLDEIDEALTAHGFRCTKPRRKWLGFLLLRNQVRRSKNKR